MLQRNEENIAPVLGVRRGGTPHKEGRDALLDAKDETIAELKAQVSLLRDELRSKNAMLLRVTESIGELSARVSEPRAALGRLRPEVRHALAPPPQMVGRSGRSRRDPSCPKVIGW
jgi:hypothetical protein